MFMKSIHIWLLLVATFATSFVVGNENPPDKTVLIAILARNKAHVLPRFLKCIENQDYPKNLITIYIKTDNNSDSTKDILDCWAAAHKADYKMIISDDTCGVELPNNTNPHQWTAKRLSALATIRNNSLQKAKEYACDYYFVVDCDNFIAPYTLTDLVAKNKPIIAPLLRCIPEVDDLYSNFFYACRDDGYYQHHDQYIPILQRKLIGTFKVDLVHCTYLVNSNYIDKLNYIDGTNDYEFIIFARYARKNGVEQYVTNEKEYGVQIHFDEHTSLEEEKHRMEAILTLP